MRRYGMRGFGAVTGASVKAAQQEMNTILVAQGFVPITADGIVGPKTCGAARATAHPILAELKCASFVDPARSAAGPAIPGPGPNAPAAPGIPPGPLAPTGPAAAGMFGFDTKTIVIGAAVVGAGIVAVYFLKKKSQAGAAA